MAEDYEACDLCGQVREWPPKFCTLCGLDYCDECKMTHDAHHEFAAEAMGIEEQSK